jgi:hypothetical protein
MVSPSLQSKETISMMKLKLEEVLDNANNDNKEYVEVLLYFFVMLPVEIIANDSSFRYVFGIHFNRTHKLNLNDKVANNVMISCSYR